MIELQEEQYHDVTKPRRTKRSAKCTRTRSIGSFQKRSRERIRIVANPQMSFRIHGVSLAAFEHEKDDRIRVIGSLVRPVKNHPRRDAIVPEVETNHPRNPFSAKDQKNDSCFFRNVECFELCMIAPDPVFIRPEVLARRPRLLYLWDMLDFDRTHKTVDKGEIRCTDRP